MRIRGFSLLEIIISLLLSSFIFLLLSSSSFNLSQSNRIKTEAIQIEQSANIFLNYLHKNLASTGAYLAEADFILSGQNAVDADKNDSISYGYEGMLDCAGTKNIEIKFEKLIMHDKQLRCDGNGGLKPSPQPMLDNIVSLQFLYGVDVDNDSSVNQYLTAEQVTDWQQVKSIQAGLLLRSQNQVFNQSQKKTYQIFDHKITTNDRYLYRKFSLSVALRNRLPKISRVP